MKLGLGVFFLLLPLAAYGFVLLRRRRAPVWILTAPLITVSITALVAYGTPRFRHSAELTIVVLAAIALDRLWTRARPLGRRDAPARASA